MRALLTALLLAVGLQSFGQSVQWRFDVLDTPDVQCLRLPNGGFAVVTFEQTQATDRVTARLLDANGVLAKQTVLYEQWARTNYRLMSLCQDTSRIFVCLAAEYGQSGLLASCKFDGTGVWSLQTGWAPRRVVAKGGMLFMAGDSEYPSDPSFNRAFVQRYNAETGANVGLVIVSNVESSSNDLALGPGNILYATGRQFSAAGQMWVARLRDDLTFVWFKSFNMAASMVQEPRQLAFDAAAARVIVAGSVWDGFTGEGQLFVSTFASSTGVPAVSKLIDFGGWTDEFLGFGVSNAGYYLYGEGGLHQLRKFDRSLNQIWAKDVDYGYSKAGLTMGNFADIFIARADENQPISTVERRSEVTGDLLWTSSLPPGQKGVPKGVATDPAGNVYEYGAAGEPFAAPNSYLLKHRQAHLSFAKTAFVGGAVSVGTITLTAPAPSAGITFNLTSSNVGVGQVPGSVTIPAAGTNANFNLTTTPVSSNVSVLITASSAGTILQQTITVLPPQLEGISINPNSVLGGLGTNGTVNLNGKAPAGGRVVSLTSNKPVVTVPNSVTIPQNSLSATFPLTTSPVLVNTGVVVTATLGVVSKTAFMAVNAPALQSFTVTPTTVAGGQPITLTLGLNGNAPAGYVVQLISGAPSLVITPSSTSMTAGSVTKSLSVATTPVTASINVTLIAYRGPYVKTATVTLTP